jgi:predicted ester cyclase
LVVTPNVLEQHIAALNAHDLEGVLAGLGPAVEWMSPGGVVLQGPGQVEQFLVAWWRAFPDATFHVGAQVVGDAVGALEATLVATHAGTLRTPSGDISSTGRTVRIPCAAILRLDAGRIAAKHLYFDLADVLAQLGVADQFAGAG